MANDQNQSRLPGGADEGSSGELGMATLTRLGYGDVTNAP